MSNNVIKNKNLLTNSKVIQSTQQLLTKSKLQQKKAKVNSSH